MKKSTKGVLVFILFIVAVVVFVGVWSNMEEKKEAEKQAELARIEEKEKAEERERIFQYDMEHREERYENALKAIKEKKPKVAKELLGKVLAVDEEYKDAKKLVQDIDEAAAKLKRETELVKAKTQIIEAKKLAKSNNCGEISQAIAKCKQALRTLPDSKEAKAILLDAEIHRLRCSEGNSELAMSIQIIDYKPLTLHVWIENKSDRVRHANPNHFTLVTVGNRSFSVSSETYSLGNYFDAVDLQSGTKTDGSIVFDTREKPKKLVYAELIGSKIEREFPFK